MIEKNNCSTIKRYWHIKDSKTSLMETYINSIPRTMALDKVAGSQVIKLCNNALWGQTLRTLGSNPNVLFWSNYY